MDYTNSLSHRRYHQKRHRNNALLERQKRLNTQIDTLPNISYEHNDLNHETPGLSHSEFSNPLLASPLFDAGDESTRIRALLIKGQYKPLTDKEKSTIQKFYYMQDAQSEKDNRFVISEGYKTAKKAIGLNKIPLI